MSILTTTEENVNAVMREQRELYGPHDDRGRKIPRDCPRCGCGRLRYEGWNFWRCDGLKDPEDVTKELEACDYMHEDGTKQEEGKK